MEYVFRPYTWQFFLIYKIHFQLLVFIQNKYLRYNDLVFVYEGKASCKQLQLILKKFLICKKWNFTFKKYQTL